MNPRKPWTWVCVQHPMPLLVQDRGVPDVLERIPPWGDPDLETYSKKFHDVLDSLEKYPDFRIDFEISARELEDVLAVDPSVIERMRDMLARGKLGFVGGDYSQSHCHVYGAESCLRQIQYGLAVFKRLFGYSVRVFFHQETGLHDQLPQILRAMGYTVAVPPRFPYVLEFTGGASPELTSHYGVLEFVNGADFTYWEGLDGTRIPLYLSMPAPSQSDEIIEVFQTHGNPDVRKERFEGISPFEQFMERERQKNPVTVPSILIENPDMKRITEDYHARRAEKAEFSLLGDALAAELKDAKIESRARLFAYWSYIEGVWAESLSRQNRRSESLALQAEALAAMASAETGEQVPADFDRIWRGILSSQHHDIYWIETTDLKRQALGWLEQAAEESSQVMRKAMGEIARRVDTGWARTRDIVLLFNTTPWARRSVERIPMSFEPGRARTVRLFDAEQRPVEEQIFVRERWEDGSIRTADLLASPEVPGLGYRAFAAELSGEEPEAPAQAIECGTFENPWMRAVIHGDGTLSSLVHARTGTELLAAGARGNEMRLRLGEDGQWLSSRRDGASATWRRGSLADVVRVEGEMGPILFSEDILLYHDHGRMDFVLTLDFGDKGVALGNFWDDHTKLNVFWPFAIEGSWRHDIPFGSIPARERRPLYCTNWIDLSSDELGVTYFNTGTTKHWVEENALANVLAWGGNWFSNRHPGIWEYVKKYDLRLFGRHTVEASLCLHDGDWRQANAHRLAEERANPLAVCWDHPHAGRMRSAKGLMEIHSPHLGLSAVLRGRAARGIACRLYEAQGTHEDIAGLGIDSPLRMHSVRNLAGERVKSIGPFAIVELEMEGAPDER